MGETYTNLLENDFAEAENSPQAGFALNINRASYSNIRRFLNNDLPVPPDAVRIEEMLNYFDLHKFSNTNRNNFTCTTQLTASPWNTKNRLLFINLQAPYINVDSAPPANLVFLIDVSGSMDHPSRLPLLKDAFKMLVNNLREKDTVAVIIYGGLVGTFLQPISCAYKDSIIKAIDRLQAGGETPGAAAIKTAYALAERMYNREANNRIILATDGDFNVGQTTDKELEDLIVAHRQSGIYLTCLGVGMGNYKDSKLEILAKKGNGNFAYIDNLYEAEKVLVAEFSKTLYAVANDAYIHVFFNPYYVKRYRLIGFDNRKELVENNVTELEGGEVGSGHSMLAVFEIEPGNLISDSIMRNSPEVNLARLQLHYKLPETGEEVSGDFPVTNNFEDFKDCDSSIRFATAVIMFGGLLKQSELWDNFTWDDVFKTARASAATENYSQKEFLTMVEKAKTIYEPYKRKKKK
jgi:Ca-activated chloride channel family protein